MDRTHLISPEWDRVYELHSRTRGYRRRIERAQCVIDESWKLGTPRAVSVSWGKDSVVLLDMLRRRDPEIFVFTLEAGVSLPESLALRDRLVREWRLNYVEYRTPDAFEMYRRHGWTHKWLEQYFDQFPEDYGIEVQFVGYRKQENDGRRALLSARGPLFWSEKAGHWVCAPLADLTGRDVMAYAWEHEVPLSEVYRKLRFHKEPSDIRTGWITGPDARTWGRYAWLRYYHPDLWAKVREVLPEAGRFA